MIAISVEAFEAIARTLPLGSVGYEADAKVVALNDRGGAVVTVRAVGERV